MMLVEVIQIYILVVLLVVWLKILSQLYDSFQKPLIIYVLKSRYIIFMMGYIMKPGISIGHLFNIHSR